MSTDNKNKLRLRTDGIYVQFGYRPWESWLGRTDDCWYNLLKVVDDKNLVLLGHFNKFPFYEIDTDTHKPIERKFCLDGRWCSSFYKTHINQDQRESYEKINNNELKLNLLDTNKNKMNLGDYCEKVLGNDINYKPDFLGIYRKDYWDEQFLDGSDTINPDGTKNWGKREIKDKSFPSVIDHDNCDNFEVIKDMYEYIGLNLEQDNFDVINVVKKLQHFDWTSLNDKIQITGIDQITNYYDDKNEDEDEDEDNKYDENGVIKLKHISSCSSGLYNDPFGLITYSNNTNSFYIKYSHCWIEGNHDNGSDSHYKSGDVESNGEQIPFKILTNSFKFTFVPFDLNEKSIWIDEYIKWKERFEYHKYYINKKNNI